ncbi:LIM domain protein [Cooperia oncophora]
MTTLEEISQPMSSTSPTISSFVASAFGMSVVCHLAILERYFLVLEHRSYHPQCLRCALCHCGLSYEPTCYVKDGLVLCRRDYTA